MTKDHTAGAGEGWDVVFCLDTLLYEGDFVETALINLHAFMSPNAVGIFEFPSKIRARISRALKGKRYGGPQWVFYQSELRALLKDRGYECVEVAFQYSELGPSMHRWLSRLIFTPYLPLLSTWTHVAVRPLK